MIKGLPLFSYPFILIAVFLDFSFIHTFLLIATLFLINHKADINGNKESLYADYLPLLLPLLWHTPQHNLLIYLMFITSLCFWFIDYLPRKARLPLIFILLIIFVYSSLISTRVITDLTHLDLERLWWGKPDLLTQTQLMRNQALYLPYPLRFLIFSPYLIYPYQVLKTAAGLLSPFQLTTFLSIVNLYLISLGLYHHLRRPDHNDRISIIFISTTLFIAGTNRSPDNFDSFYPLLPFLLYYLRLGVPQASSRTIFILTLASLLILPGLFI